MSFQSSVQFSCSVVSDCLPPHGLQHARPPCPSPTPRVYSNSCPLSRWCHPTISSSVIPFSRLQFFPASGSFQMSQFFTSGGQSTGISALASVLPMNIQGWFPLGWTGWISLLSKRLSRVFLVRNELLNFGPWSSLLSGETAETFFLDCLEASFAAILCRTPFPYLPHGCIPYSSAASHLPGSSSLTTLEWSEHVWCFSWP